MFMALLLAYRNDQVQMVNKIGEAKDGPKGHNGPQKAKDHDILEVLLEILLFEIVSSSEDHGRKKPVEEDFFIKVDISDVFAEEHD